MGQAHAESAASGTTAPRGKPLVGLHQIGTTHDDSYSTAQHVILQMVLRSLNTGRVIVFAGAGLSMPFGYPGWRDLLLELRQRLLGPITPGATDGTLDVDLLLEELAHYDDTLAGTAVHGRPHCGSGISIQNELSEIIHEYEKKPAPPGGDELFRSGKAIIDILHKKLGIKRFITTNYDAVFSRQLQVQERRRLIASADNLGSLWQFAVEAHGIQPSVFHCHGHADIPGSLIVVERDYRRVYLGDSWEAKCFRRVMELIFDVNPILFLGSGVVEEDVLRHLRTYLARESFVRRDRPVFALLPRWTIEGHADGGEAFFFRRMRDLKTTYNIKALFYDSGLKCESGKEPQWESPGVQAQTTVSLRDYLDSLSKKWSQWSDDYQYKPSTREVSFRAHPAATDSQYAAVIRHAIPQKGFTRWPASSAPRSSTVPFAPRDHKRLCEELARGNGIVLLLGRRGTSKGTIGEWLVKEWPSGQSAARDDYEHRIFVSAHFSNDLATLITGIVEKLEGAQRPEDHASLMLRLKRNLESRKALVVIGGFERLLQPLPGARVAGAIQDIGNNRPRDLSIGTAATGDVQDLIHVLGDLADMAGGRGGGGEVRPPPKSLVVITSSMVPVDWLEERRPSPRVVALEGLADADIAAWFKEPLCDEIDKMVHALRGHAYGMSVLDRVARRGWPVVSQGSGLDKEWLKEVLRDLRITNRDRRLEKLLHKSLQRLRAAEEGVPAHRDWRVHESLVKAAAFFTVPVNAEELHVAVSAISEREDGCSAPSLKETREALKWLVENRLLLQVMGSKHGGSVRYTAHSVMRACVLHTLGSLPVSSGEPHALALEGFAKRLTEAHGASGESERIAERIFEKLHAGALQATRDGNRETARLLLQGATALLRGRWTATGIGCLHAENGDPVLAGDRSRADSYHFKLVRTLNAIREVSLEWYDYRVDNKSIRDPAAILYADELSWIYNEIGLVWFLQGALEDADVIFRLGHDVNVVCEGGIGGPRWCQAEINLALVQIERGYLKRARAHLENVLRHCRKENDEDIYGRVMGFLGLVLHLRGEGDAAWKCYNTSISISQEVGNQRAQSIFLRHKSDLERKRGNTDGARQCIRESIAAAEAGQDLDLFAYARVAEENLNLRERAVKGEAYECRLGDVRSMAQELGLPKLDAEACLVEGYGALSMGELERAMELAVHCMGVCGGMGMRLRLSSAQVLLGRLLMRQHDRKTARRVLEAVVETGRRFGYQTKIEEASSLLLELRANQ